ncbi:MAG: dihydropteroate synthase [Acidobacteria bacterium]|nr:dihydropteroate synthase [Acidobacteriota bacterium]
MDWKTNRRVIPLDRPLVMGILNVTPDSFSDGGKFADLDSAIQRAEELIAEGADIIDVGGESTRPGSIRVAAEEEVRRTAPAIEAISRRFDTPISIDTTKLEVAKAAIEAGAEIINDISGLRWEEQLAAAAAASGAGLVLMHSRGEFETMHSQPPVRDILVETIHGLNTSIEVAAKHAVLPAQIVLDIGIGFGKTPEQNLELLAKLDKIVAEFDDFPILVGASRKSFIVRTLGPANAEARLGASLAAVIVSVQNGAKIVRVHDVAETGQAIKLLEEFKNV